MEEPTKKQKIGFCFMIKDQFFNQEIWKEFFKDIPQNEYKIYIHYKQKCRMILENHEFINSIPTKWGSISLVKATFRLFEHAINDNCSMMFLLSGDALPLQSYSNIAKIKNTTFRPLHMDMNKKTNFCLQNYNSITSHMKENLSWSQWRKQHMFFCMTREDFQKIQAKPKLHNYANVTIPDEFYFINQCTYLNIPYKLGKYIYIGRSDHRTQALNLTETHIKQHKNQISKFLFIRKVVDYRTLPTYANLFNATR